MSSGESWKDEFYQHYRSRAGLANRSVRSGGRVIEAKDELFEFLVRSFLPPRKDVRIMDLGCGAAPLGRVLLRHGYKEYSGIDLSEEQVSAARADGITGVRAGDIMRELRGDTQRYDVFFTVDIIEHLERDQISELLAAIRSCAAPGALLIGHVPNAGALFGMRACFADYSHCTHFTKASVAQMLRVSGFEPLVVREDPFFSVTFKTWLLKQYKRVLEAVLRVVLAPVVGLRTSVLRDQLTFVARLEGVVPTAPAQTQ